MKKQIGKIKLPKSGKKAILGVAIEDHLISYVEAIGTSRGLSISRFGEVRLESDSGDKEDRAKELTQVFSALHRRSKTKTLQIAIPDGSATFFEMYLPESDPFLLEHMVEREVKKALGETQGVLVQNVAHMVHAADKLQRNAVGFCHRLEPGIHRNPDETVGSIPIGLPRCRSRKPLDSVRKASYFRKQKGCRVNCRHGQSPGALSTVDTGLLHGVESYFRAGLAWCLRLRKVMRHGIGTP